MSILKRLLSSSKFTFLVFWLGFTAAFFFWNGHQMSEFLVLIPYSLIAALLAALMTFREWALGNVTDSDDEN